MTEGGKGMTVEHVGIDKKETKTIEIAHRDDEKDLFFFLSKK